MKIALVTGGFDPLHSGHIKYFKAAAKEGDKLYVGINSDDWLANKKGKPFMPYDERESIIKELRCVDGIVEFDDYDGSSSDAIHELLKKYKKASIIFCNGGDRKKENIPEADIFADEKRVVFKDGVGGTEKINSSSWIVLEYMEGKNEIIESKE